MIYLMIAYPIFITLVLYFSIKYMIKDYTEKEKQECWKAFWEGFNK